jgi:hypothetical protein
MKTEHVVQLHQRLHNLLRDDGYCASVIDSPEAAHLLNTPYPERETLEEDISVLPIWIKSCFYDDLLKWGFIEESFDLRGTPHNAVIFGKALAILKGPDFEESWPDDFKTKYIHVDPYYGHVNINYRVFEN